MLSCTFQHIEGIGATKESNLWRSGITSWKDMEILQNKQSYMFTEFAKSGEGLASAKNLFKLKINSI